MELLVTLVFTGYLSSAKPHVQLDFGRDFGACARVAQDLRKKMLAHGVGGKVECKIDFVFPKRKKRSIDA